MKDNALIKPESPKNGAQLPGVCVLVSNQRDMAGLCAKAKLDKSFSILSSRVFYSEKNGFCVAGPFIGAPYAAILMENLAVCGCERFVFWGWCGSVSGSLCIGDILIPEIAFADDGTSFHYLPAGQKSISPSSVVSGTLMDCCARAGLAVSCAPVWTMDAIYRETPEKIRKFQKKGAVAVDMETAALFSVSSFLGRQTAAILVVSDELATMTWKPGFGFKRFREVRARVAEMMAVFMTDK